MLKKYQKATIFAHAYVNNYIAYVQTKTKRWILWTQRQFNQKNKRKD